MALQEMPDARINVPLHEIVVRAEHIDHAHTQALPGDVFEFVDRMLWDGRYPRRALPRDAALAAAVHYFMNIWLGDDLATFIESTGWDEALNEDIREGFRRLGFDEFSAMFAGLEDFVAGIDPEAFEDGDWVRDPVLQELETRFAPIPYGRYYEQLAAWIRGWPNLRGVPAAQYQTVLKELSERNRTSPP
ncbi:MAG TPA: hypothetical protein VFX98_01850 [Longimicrobiaceae bacterium]|nr:hypothetical protein [Longimicrobiaceae bacterium]